MSKAATKAYRIGVRGHEGTGVYFAVTAGAAKYDSLLSVRDVYPTLSFGDLVCKRAPELDRLASIVTDRDGHPRQGLMPDFLTHVAEQAEAVAAWNAAYPVGTPVRVRLDGGGVMETTTRSGAVLQCDNASVWLEDMTGSYSLSHVTPLQPAEAAHG